MLREPDCLAVAPHVRVPADGIPHFREGQIPHGDGAAPQHLETRLAVERNEEILAHKHCPAHVWQTAEVLQVAPHQDGPFALLPERAVHCQNVDVHGGAAGFVDSQRVLEERQVRGPRLIMCGVSGAAWIILTVESLSWSHREPMINATNRPSSNQPMDSSGHNVRK